MKKSSAEVVTVMSSKGQVVLPKAIRSQRNWGDGTKLIVEDTPHGVLLRPKSPFPPTTMDQVFGSANYKGPPVSIEEMNMGVREMARRRNARD